MALTDDETRCRTIGECRVPVFLAVVVWICGTNRSDEILSAAKDTYSIDPE